MKTAVEWFDEKIGHNSLMALTEYNEILEQAKAIEKEQIMDAFDKGLITENVYYGYDDKKSEQHYNETYESNT